MAKLPPSDRRSGDAFWVDQTRAIHTRTAAAYGIVAVPDVGHNAHRLTGGRLLERVHLWTAANGIALQHMDQMTERADRERQLGLPSRFGREVRSLIPDGGWEPLVAFRVGYAKGGPQEPAASGRGGDRMRTAISSPSSDDGRGLRGRRRDRLAGRLALAGACFGVLAGLLELTIGPSVRDWVGDERDTTRLGLMTTILSIVALTAAAALGRRREAVGGRRVALALGLLIPALGGRGGVLAGTRREEFAAALDERHWRVGLLLLCGAYYILLGATALGPAGLLGILGGVLIWSVASTARHSCRVGYAFLAIGALPLRCSDLVERHHPRHRGPDDHHRPQRRPPCEGGGDPRGTHDSAGGEADRVGRRSIPAGQHQ